MKRVVLMIIPALICGTIFWIASSCNKESSANSALNIKVVGILDETATKSYLAEEGLKFDTLLLMGDNIEWFNATTREVKFKIEPDGNSFLSVFGGLVAFIVYLDETKLFTLDAITCFSSYSLNHPVLTYGCPDINDDPYNYISPGYIKYHIGRGYPDWEYWTEKFWTDTNWDKNADWVKEREKNWNAIKPGWNKFIEQLKKEGKYRK